MSLNFDPSAIFLDALGDSRRVAILRCLAKRQYNVGELCEAIQMRQQAVSHHLTILKLRRLVTFDRDGKYNLYSLMPLGVLAIQVLSLLEDEEIHRKVA